MTRKAITTVTCLALAAACGRDGDAPRDVHDTLGDAAPEVDDAGSDAVDAVAPDGDAEVTAPALAVVPPIGPAASDPLAEGHPESCAVYLAGECRQGRARTCELYDTATRTFIDAPDALVRRAYLYDRWYDLYHRPDGVTAERVFATPIEPGTPESEWGARDRFDSYAGVGDGAIWTGAALNAAA